MLLNPAEFRILKDSHNVESRHGSDHLWFFRPDVVEHSGTFYDCKIHWHDDGPDYGEMRNPDANGGRDRFKKGFYFAKITGSVPLYYDGEQFHRGCFTCYYDVGFKYTIDQLEMFK